jgi:hypothetical protein
MSNAEQKLVARLLAINAVTAIVGAGNTAKIWPIKMTQGITGDAIVYQRGPTQRVNGATTASSTSRVTLDLHVVCSTYPRQKTLVAAVKGNPENSNGATGLNGWTDADGCVWHLVDEYDDPGPMKSGVDEPEDWGALLRFVVWCND